MPGKGFGMAGKRRGHMDRLRLIEGAGEGPLEEAVEDAALALERLALRLPASDVLADPAAALARCLHRRLLSRRRGLAAP